MVSIDYAMLFPLTLALMSFPIERLVVQGNIEIFLWIFAAAGVWEYLRDHDDVAAILWGLAAASKLYPVVLLCCFCRDANIVRSRLECSCLLEFRCCRWRFLDRILRGLEGHASQCLGYQQFRAGEISTRELNANHSLFLLVKFAAAVSGIRR